MVSRMEALERIAQQSERGELIFPTQMAASLRLQQALDKPECPLDEAAELVLAEPLIAARLVSMANSVAYSRFGRNVGTVHSAVGLLGINRLRALVAAIVVRQLSAQAPNALIRSKGDQLWQHCAHVAALAKVVAREFTTLDPEATLFTGVVHEIDGFYLLSRAQEFPALMEPETGSADTVQRATLARHIMLALKIPRPIATAVLALYTDEGQVPPVSASDVLALANALAPVTSPLTTQTVTSANADPASVDFEVNGKSLRAVLEANADELHATAEALLL